jgi:peptidoglycan/xylan/chitin deacetylase (PgdA/CDA1 family)
MHPAYDVLKQHRELWDLYTRKEEYMPKRRDQYDCFPYAAGTYQDILEPMVSKYLVDNGFDSRYPANKQFAVCLSHDVDEIYPPLNHALLSSLTCIKKQDFSGLTKQIFWKLRGREKSPYRNFRRIMDLEEKYSACSSFYFLATNSDITRFRYNIEDLEDELGRINDRGWEVGLHTGYYAFNDSEKILREKKRLEKVLDGEVTGNRNHYLRFQVPDSWEYLKRAGFRYDTSLGYNEMVGFRNGMCHPFRPFNLHTGREINILEIPLTIMDDTLFESTMSYEEVWELSKRLIDTVAEYHGVICLNWHSESFNCPFKDPREIMYKKILQYCSDKKAWMTSGEKIYEWWEKNEY